VSSTLSKIYKRGSSQADIRPLTLPSAAEPGKPGVHPFEYEQAIPFRGQGSERAPVAETAGLPLTESGPAIDLEAIRKQAFQEGFSEGESAGREQASAKFRDAVDSFGQAVRSLVEYKPTLRHATQRELVALAMAVAQRVLKREVTLDPATVLGVVRTCLEEFNTAEMNRLEVSPRDYDVVSGYFQDHPIQNLEIVADPAVSPGGAVFETSHGKLDARIETQLEEIEYGLADG